MAQKTNSTVQMWSQSSICINHEPLNCRWPEVDFKIWGFSWHVSGSILTVSCSSWKKVKSLVLHRSWLNVETSWSRLSQIVKAFQNPAPLTALAPFSVFLEKLLHSVPLVSSFLDVKCSLHSYSLVQACPLLWMSFKCPPLAHDPKPTNLCAPSVTTTML